MLQVILPLKDLASAKGRLAEVLDPEARQRLVVALALDTLELLKRESCVEAVTVVAGDRWEEHLPRVPGLRVIPEHDLGVAGLNPLLERAADRVNAQKTLILHGDLPFLTHIDIEVVHQRLGTDALLVCPDEAGTGTNALAFHSSARPPFCFGDRSFAAHCSRAESRRQPWTSVETRGFEFDVDSPADLRALIKTVDSGQRVGHRTAAWVANHRADFFSGAPEMITQGADLPMDLAGSTP